MIHKTWLLHVLALVPILAVVGCGTTAPPTPTRGAPTQPVTPVQITVVITATPPPPTATVSQPTITPIPTLAITATVPVATPVPPKPTNTPVTPRPAVTRTPTKAAPVATTAPTAVPLKYAAPRIIGPVFDEGLGRKDERHYPADVLKFEWQSVGPLQGNECYLIRVDMVPGQGDAFLQCDPSSTGTQAPLGATASFILNKPNQAGPNYAALLPTSAGETNVNWYVQVVRDNGKGTGAQTGDGVRHNTVPLSPKSNTVMFLLKGG